MPIRTNRNSSSVSSNKSAKKQTDGQVSKKSDDATSGVRYGYENETAKPNRFVDEQEYHSSLDDDEMDDTPIDVKADTTKIKIAAGIVAVIVVIAIIVIVRSFNSKNSDSIVIDASSATTGQEPATTEEPSFVQGDNDYSDSKKNQTEIGLSDPSEFVKDLEGAEIPVNYAVQSRNYVTAHVTYVAKRAIIDDGMEMYWIDVDYKKKKYRLQVPFYYFKDLEDKGVCRVEIEVLSLENGGQIISYMHVIDESDGTE